MPEHHEVQYVVLALEEQAARVEGRDVFVPRHLGPQLCNETSCCSHLLPAGPQQVSGILGVGEEAWSGRYC